MKQVQDVIERLWDFIDKLDINTFGKLVTTRHFFWNLTNHDYSGVSVLSLLLTQCHLSSGKFLADNIVGSVVVFSLIFWIPLSILVHCVVRNSIYTSSQCL